MPAGPRRGSAPTSVEGSAHGERLRANSMLNIEDSGIGITKKELVNSIGATANSGTKASIEATAAGGEISMIDKFGDGFYSAYLISDKARAVSKHDDDEKSVWESAMGGYVAFPKDAELMYGETRYYLKEHQPEHLEEHRLNDLVPDEEKEKDRKNKATRKVKEVSHEWKQLNKNTPLWMRKLANVTNEEYASSFTPMTNDWKDHFSVKPFCVDAQLEFRALLFVPETTKVEEVSHEWKQLDKNKPLWVRKSENVTNEEYASSCTPKSKDWKGHFSVKPFCVDRQLELRALLFVPAPKTVQEVSQYWKQLNKSRLLWMWNV